MNYKQRFLLVLLAALAGAPCLHAQSHRYVNESIQALNADLGSYFVLQRIDLDGEIFETSSIVKFPESGRPSFRSREAFPPDRMHVTSEDNPDADVFWNWVDLFADRYQNPDYRNPELHVGDRLSATIYLDAPRMGSTLELIAMMRRHYLVDSVELYTPALFLFGEGGSGSWIHNGVERTPSPFMITPLDDEFVWRDTWMGQLDDLNYPTINHAQHGLIRIEDFWFEEGKISALVYQDIDFGQCFTNEDLYPYIFDQTSEQWLFYLEGSTSPRWFYNFSSEAWEAY